MTLLNGHSNDLDDGETYGAGLVLDAGGDQTRTRFVQVVADAVKSPGLVVLVPMVRPVDCGYALDLELTDNDPRLSVLH